MQEVLDAQIAHEREQYQPSAAEKVFAIVKSMLLRGMIIYFFMQFFKRPQPNHQAGAPGSDGTVQLPKGAATNLFQNGTLFVSRIFQCSVLFIRLTKFQQKLFQLLFDLYLLFPFRIFMYTYLNLSNLQHLKM